MIDQSTAEAASLLQQAISEMVSVRRLFINTGHHSYYKELVKEYVESMGAYFSHVLNMLPAEQYQLSNKIYKELLNSTKMDTPIVDIIMIIDKMINEFNQSKTN